MNAREMVSRKLLQEYFEARNPREFRRACVAAGIANASLRGFSPSDHRLDHRRFSAALSRLREYKDYRLCEVWIDRDCDHVTNEEPYIEYDEKTGQEEVGYQDIYSYSSKEVAKILFGLCSDYI